jgi:hypothetical protein
MKPSLCWEASDRPPDWEFPIVYVVWRLNIVFTRSRHRTLSWASIIQFAPTYPTSLKPVLILSFLLRLDLPGDIFLWVSVTETLYAFYISPFLFHITLFNSVNLAIFGGGNLIQHDHRYIKKNSLNILRNKWPLSLFCTEANVPFSTESSVVSIEPASLFLSLNMYPWNDAVT